MKKRILVMLHCLVSFFSCMGSIVPTQEERHFLAEHKGKYFVPSDLEGVHFTSKDVVNLQSPRYSYYFPLGIFIHPRMYVNALYLINGYRGTKNFLERLQNNPNFALRDHLIGLIKFQNNKITQLLNKWDEVSIDGPLFTLLGNYRAAKELSDPLLSDDQEYQKILEGLLWDTLKI